MAKLYGAGNPIDATFSIIQFDADGFDLYFESRSGAKNTPAARNTQYEPGLELLLTRIFDLGIRIESVALSPRNQHESTELVVPGLPFPWDEHISYSPHHLRVALGRVQAATNRSTSAKGGGNHSKRLCLRCRAERATSGSDLERALSGTSAAVDKLESIVAEIERRAATHRIGRLQRIRREIARKPFAAARESPRLFGAVRSGEYGPYTYHKGGRSELQFNLGIEPNGIQLRFGVAFSFEPSQSMPYPRLEEALTPKIARFNEFVRMHFEDLSDLRMWYERKNIRTAVDEPPAPISYNRIGRGVFIFLGGRQDLNHADYDLILEVLDRLLSLYLYIEGRLPSDDIPEGISSRFAFNPKPWKDRVAQTILQPAERALDVSLRHNEIQRLLQRSLVLRYGQASVDYEVECHFDSRVDVVVLVNEEYWFYEIKTAGSPRHCIREAIGQLLEYAYWPSAPPVNRLIVVGEKPLDPEAQAYLTALRARLSLPIDYEQITCDL